MCGLWPWMDRSLRPPGCGRVPPRSSQDLYRGKYRLGLTATPRGTDQRHRLIFLYLGDKVKSANSEELDRLGVISLPTYRYQTTHFQAPAADPHHAVLEKVTTDPIRNQQVADDVLAAIDEGHVVLLSTDRKQQCDLLAELLSNKVGLAVLYGPVGKKDRQRPVTGVVAEPLKQARKGRKLGPSQRC